MAAFALLHWLISQSVCIVQTTAYGPGPDAQRIPSKYASRIGFSVLGIIVTVAMGLVLVVLLIGHSFRRYPAVPAHFPRAVTSTQG